MSPARRRAWIGLAIAFLLLAAGAGFVATRLAALLDRPAGPIPVQVPARWKQVKESLGHRVHLNAGDVKCRDCHLFDANGFIAPGITPCTTTCHADKVAFVHGSMLARAATDCFSCHDFGGDPSIKPWACARCHVEPTGPGVAHFDQDCKNCHRPHEQPTLVPRPCKECHTDVGGDKGVVHGGHVVVGASQCLDCHESHDQSIQASRRCANCHTAQAKMGHQKCVQCHEPHRFAKAEVRACSSCHAGKRLLGPHPTCMTCHQPHDASPAAAAARCVTCHAKQTMAHPQNQRVTSCLACHPAHPTDKQVSQMGAKSALACTTCHPQAPSDTLGHAGKVLCSTCHIPHGAPATFRPKGTISCVRCHTREVAKAATNVGHKDCLGCHTRPSHEPQRPRVACATCHLAEASSAPAGHVGKCAICHDPHDGKRTPQAVCVGCHADRATPGQPHAGLKNGCASCHRAHGPKGVAKPPACLECHEQKALPNLHQNKGHTKCQDCHASHATGGPRRDRESCLRCHAAQKDHEPGAPVCSGCHPFGGKAGAVPMPVIPE